MCGPIAFALPIHGKGKWTVLWGGGLYNIGRLITYAVLGIVFGFLGKSLVIAFAQQWLSIGAGIFMILSVLLPKINSTFQIEKFGFVLVSKVKIGITQFFKKKSTNALLVIGLLNGLLPCAMVYIALAGAIAQSSPANGGLFMLLFGLGTLPMMLLTTYIGKFITVQFRNNIQRYLPWLVALIGVIFILRGLNLDIPYISPVIDRVDPEITNCD